MSIDQLMRRVAVNLNKVRCAIEHPSDWTRRDVSTMVEASLSDLHEAAAKLRAVRRELGEPEAKP